MPERFFRYVAHDRVEAWLRAGWQRLGWLAHAPNDGTPVAIMEWMLPGDAIPPEPSLDTECP